MNNGWIKLHRKLLDNPIANRPAWSWLWITLLLLANHDETHSFIWNGRRVFLNQGEFVTGRSALSEQTGIAGSTIEDILNYLESQQQIRQQKTTKYRLITIVKWKEYQKSDSKPDNKATTKRHIQEVKKLIRSTDAKASPLSNNKKDMNKYNETDSSDSYEKVIDADENEIIEPKKVNLMAKYREIIGWAEKRRGSKFIAPLKQMKGLKVMKEAGYNPNQIMDRWEELEKDKFYSTNGIDFMSVASSFDKRPLK